MYNVGIEFKILEDDESPPPGYKKSSGHPIFVVKMDFTRKYRWTTNVHRTPYSEPSIYAGVVSRESIRILLRSYDMHGVHVIAADVRNVYIQAPTSDKYYVICGPEFGLLAFGC